MFVPAADRSAFQRQPWMWFGIGYCSAHFGELMQGAFTGDHGRVVRGLVTLPYRKAGVMSQVIARAGDGQIAVPRGKTKTAGVVARYIALHGLSRALDVEVTLTSSLPEGIGMGSSTADIVATIRALDLALGIRTEERCVAQLAVKTEVACDSTMHSSGAILFAQREGEILEDFGHPLPPMAVLGLDLMPGETFLTAETPPPDYGEDEVAHFDGLRQQLRQAVRARDVDALAEVATQSAMVSQRYFPKPHFDQFIHMAKKAGASGVSVSHSGTVGAMLFAPSRAPSVGQVHQLYAGAVECGFAPVDFFHL